MTLSVLALAGGVGGAKLALGLSHALPPEKLTIVVNTGDDETFHGLHVSPDLDTVMYALAGLTNTVTGWGVAGDTFQALAMLGRYGNPTWFNLGDKDLATHIKRTQLLNEGYTLSDVTRELCSLLGIRHPMAPMTNDPLRTVIDTDEGELPFQVYFVQRRCEPKAKRIRFDDQGGAAPSPGFQAALESANALVFAPSNPFLSVAPILAVQGIRQAIGQFTGARIAVSPIVGGEALRGPAAKLLEEMGHDVSCVGVARQYAGLCDVFVIDEVDEAHAPAIEDMGMRVETVQTVMETDWDKTRLAMRILDIAESESSTDRRQG